MEVEQLAKWDIETELNKIIFEYDIDKAYPQYRNFVEAKVVLEELFENIEGKQNIILVSDRETDIEWFQKCVFKKKMKSYIFHPIEKFGNEILEDGIYLNLSFYQKDAISLTLHAERKKTIGIYQMFEKYGLHFHTVFYDVYGEQYLSFRGNILSNDWSDFDANSIFYRHRRLFEISNTDEERKYYLEKIIFDCVYVKDFLTLEKYLSYVPDNEKEHYMKFWNEVLTLLGEVKRKLHSKKDNVLIVWLDALEYGEDEDMEYLKSIDREAVVFENAYAVTPYTSAALKTIFLKSKIVTDEGYKVGKIDEENSELLKDLKVAGYEFEYYGSIDLLEKKYQKSYYNLYSVISTQYWDILRDLLLNENHNNVQLLHEVIHTHIPFLSFGITGDEYYPRQDYPGQQENKKISEEQFKQSRKYVDQQLKFWSSLLPKDMTKIYMSDHGHSIFGRFHTILKIQHKGWEAARVKKLFSYYDFDHLIRNIISGEQLKDDFLSNEYITVEDTAFYNKDFIYAEIKKKDFDPSWLFGYHGVVTDKDMLLKYDNGAEYYLKHVNDNIMVTDERLNYLRSFLHEKKINVWEEERFKASRLVYQAWNKSSIRYHEEELKKHEIISHLLDSINADKTVAIRGGGITGQRFLMILPYELRQKIKYIIDVDRSCPASYMGIPVIQPSEVERYAIDEIIIIIYAYRDLWKKELSQLDAKIVDIYDEFEKAEIYCNGPFYGRQYQAEDFE